MKKIPAPQPHKGRSHRFEEWLIPDTIPDAKGQQHSVSDLLAQCSRDYQSVTIKKNAKIRKSYARYTRQELEWIHETDLETIQYQLQLNRAQARSLKQRAQYHLRDQEQ